MRRLRFLALRRGQETPFPTVLDLCLPLVSMGCYGVLSHIPKVVISFAVALHRTPSKTLWNDS
jgi:hypothetical protein